MTQTHYSERVAEQLARIATLPPMTHKQMTAHIRARIKVAEIDARVKTHEASGCLWIHVSVPTFDTRFSPEEQRTIQQIAKTNRLTLVQGIEIDVDRVLDMPGQTYVFLFRGPKYGPDGKQ